ncbi:hypothetical protein D1007_43104 [Hordeum vulgare]|nr:hypothetical protein D1007_43104 [Hordeum vulgare]
MRRPLLIFLTAITTTPCSGAVEAIPSPRSWIPPRYDLDAKWDACLDLSISRVTYASLAGAFGVPHLLSEYTLAL